MKRILAPIAMVALLLAGCGGGGDPTVTDGSTAPPVMTTTEAVPTGTGITTATAEVPVVLDSVRTVTPEETRALISAGAVVIDVRDPNEFDAGHLKDAENLSLNQGDFEAALPTLSKDDTYILYCRSGNRSAQAAAMMKAAGFTKVGDAGAFTTLAAAGIPTG